MPRKILHVPPPKYGDPTHPVDPETKRLVCGAYIRHANKYGDRVCLQPPMVGRKRCRLHGGKAARGVDAPAYKTGVHSMVANALPERMRQAYEASLKDPQLVDLRGGIALLDSRLLDLLTRVESGESGAAWRGARAAYDDLVKAIRRSNQDAMAVALGQLDTFLRQGQQDSESWSEITRLNDEKRKHIETQNRLELAGDKVVSAADLMVFMGLVLNLVQTNVSSAREKELIANGIERFIAQRSQTVQ